GLLRDPRLAGTLALPLGKLVTVIISCRRYTGIVSDQGAINGCCPHFSSPLASPPPCWVACARCGPGAAHEGDAIMSHELSPRLRAYWRANERLVLVLLAIWAVVSFGAGIVFIETLNKVSFLGVPLGFLMAQQGSICLFVILIFVYAIGMDRLDRRYHADEDCRAHDNRSLDFHLHNWHFCGLSLHRLVGARTRVG